MKETGNKFHGRKKMSLVNRLSLLFTVSAIVILFFVNLILSIQVEKVIEELATANSRQSARMFNSSVDSLLNDAILTMRIGRNSAAYSFLNGESDEELYESSKLLGTEFRNARTSGVSKPHIFDISIIGLKGHCYSERNGFFKLGTNLLEYEFMDDIKKDLYGFHVIKDSQSISRSSFNKDSLSLIQSINTVSTNQMLGVIKVDIDKTSITDLLNATFIDNFSGAMIVNDSGNEIIPQMPNKLTIPHDYYKHNFLKQGLNSGIQKVLIQKKEYLLTYNTLSFSNWILIQVYPLQELKNKHVLGLRYLFIVVVLTSILFLILINSMISLSVVKPIVQLQKLMNSVEKGTVNLDYTCKGSPEVEKLYSSFKQLVERLDGTLKKLVIEHQSKEFSELKALQAQINPHFLYNSLDSVVWIAESGDMESVIDIIIALSRYYQVVLSNGIEMIKICNEIEHAENYLIIMQKRYFDILDYSIYTDPDTVHCMIPKMTLQPIIENSIYHGIKNKMSPGKITISILKHDNATIRIIIEDDGIGMDTDKLSQLRKVLESDSISESGSYGIANIQRRIKLYFGECFGMHISSDQGIGTAVEIIIPARSDTGIGVNANV